MEEHALSFRGGASIAGKVTDLLLKGAGWGAPLQDDSGWSGADGTPDAPQHLAAAPTLPPAAHTHLRAD